MDDESFAAGIIFGATLVLLFLLAGWHLQESECQTKHNVADCVYSKDAFIPAQVEPQ